MTPKHPKPKTKALFMIQKITQLTGQRNALGYSHNRSQSRNPRIVAKTGHLRKPKLIN